jgi:lipopolysaccharide biosynthesis glycosyltransferase
VHVLHDGTLDHGPGVEDLRSMVTGGSAELRMHAVDPSRVQRLPAIDRFGTVVWLRFLLPDLLPEVDRVLYLDGDTLAMSDLGPLFGHDLDGAPLGAVANVLSAEQRQRTTELGVNPEPGFFNSGVLLLDLEALRSEGATAELLQVAADRADELVWPDQDALNIAFSGRWCPLHPRWNAQNAIWSSPRLASEVFGAEAATDARRTPGILHFEGPSLAKPWHVLNPHPLRGAWRRTLARTPWADVPQEGGSATTALLRFLPRGPRVRLYFMLERWRSRRLSAR